MTADITRALVLIFNHASKISQANKKIASHAQLFQFMNSLEGGRFILVVVLVNRRQPFWLLKYD